MTRYRPFFIILCLIVATGGHWLQAAGLPDFSGTWILDLEAPEATSLQAIMEAQGASWIEQKAVDTLSVTQEISQTEKTLTIRSDSALGGRTRILYLDGSPQIQDTDRAGKLESRTFWDKDGTTLVTVIKSASPDMQKHEIQKSEYTIRRYLREEGSTQIVDHSLNFEDGRKLTARRVLRKQ